MTNGLSPHRPGWHTLARLPRIPAAVLANLETNALRGLEPDVTLTTLKHLTLALAVAAALSACKKDDAAPAAAAAAAPAETPKLVIDESKLPKLPYFAATDLDANTPVCQDLNGHVNGKWIAANPIPADKTSWGNFNILSDRSLFVQQQIVEAAAAAKNAPGSNEQKLGDFYRLGLDDAKLNTDGITPLKPTLARIDALADGAGVAQYLVDSFSHGDQFVFGFGAAEDFKNASQVIAYANEGGLSLPERAYYLEPQHKDIRDAFLAHVERMLGLGGVEAAAAKTQAQAVLAFETRLAKPSLSPIEGRDPKNQYNFVSIADAEKATPNFSWTRLFAAEGITGVTGFSLSQPKFFAEFNKMLADVPAADWQAYLRYHALNDAAPFLSDAVNDERFAFNGKALSGQPEQQPRWKRVLGTVNTNLGEALGQLYVQQVFPQESKVAMQALVANLRGALKDRLEKLDWMSVETKAKAQEKLSTFNPMIGYPDKWRDYSGLSIDGKQSYYANVMASAAFENAYQMNKVGKPVDRQEWGMSPQTVNAYYNPLKNEIVFPAAILQPPFFDVKADPALNYGGIGAVIGHEIMHGFDDQGSQFDAKGNNTNWWTDADNKAFKERTSKLVKQFDDYVAIDDLHVKGQLTLGENIGDLSGITIAYDALQRDLMNKKMALIDGFSQDQRFFLNFATIWRNNMRPEALKVMLNTNPHSPAMFRANGAPSNMDQFAAAFQCKAGDAMVRSGDKKVVLW
ncbi:MAG: M13 family metallopeptidase [Frankiaceae bacterium]|nr:M13 family metallopeptidase [Arenimonas sp.]